MTTSSGARRSTSRRWTSVRPPRPSPTAPGTTGRRTTRSATRKAGSRAAWTASRRSPRSSSTGGGTTPARSGTPRLLWKSRPGPPRALGGQPSYLRPEMVGVDFDGFSIADPALLEPTEWFAYRTDFDDGVVTPWVYMGSLAPPKLDVLVVHSICLSGNTCAEYQAVQTAMSGLDLVGSVTGWNFFPIYNPPPYAPTVAQMLAYDVVVFGSNWAFLGYPPYDQARVDIGNNLADAQDLGLGVVTLMATYDLSSFYGDIFALLGRYVTDDYGAFEQEIYNFGNGNLGTKWLPNHEVLKNVNTLTSTLIYSGDYALTVGGGGMAAGQNGVLLADWSGGQSAIGVKELSNGARSVD